MTKVPADENGALLGVELLGPWLLKQSRAAWVGQFYCGVEDAEMTSNAVCSFWVAAVHRQSCRTDAEL